ncbi:outer membrane efflux protein [Nitrosococcus halophilus Nc 4]|uniref:Outer membrane efflux protein n=1 Tax=Nitrosococcus halophilus (strain Nc4) TaxID=472759 RepID=D5C2X6_NITHN|nr:TolC family protein [Nitrosococcus halophilus]ADE14868.1 outer membrane efflux protein [Nitrosococcus halophilus Nc 4]
MRPQLPSGADKKPMLYRFLGIRLAVTVWLLSVPCFLAASETHDSPAEWLTAQEAIRLGLSRPEVNRWVEGQIGVAQSEAAQTALWPNPQLQYQREETNTGGGASIDEFLWLTQKFDFSGRRGLQVNAAKQQVQATRQEAEFRRLVLTAKIRQGFYQVLHQWELLQNLEQWFERLGVIETVVQKREAAGEISGYDRLRLTREQAAARAQMQSEEAVYYRAWEQLLGILGAKEKKTVYRGVTGSLLPQSLPPLERLLQTLIYRPDLQSLEQQANAHALERQAAARGWIPDLTLSLGSKKAKDAFGSDAGPFFSAGINLPLFDRHQAKRDRASARLQVVRSEYQLALTEAQGAVRGRWQEVRQLAATAREVRRRDVVAARELVRTAKVAYEGGEIGILELLDAYREEMNTVTRALELERRARQAQIELERLAGEGLS